MKARIQAGVQVDALVLSAPQTVRQSLRGLAGKHRIRGCAALRPGPIADLVNLGHVLLMADIVR